MCITQSRFLYEGVKQFEVGAIAEYPAAREHKLLATAVPWSMNK